MHRHTRRGTSGPGSGDCPGGDQGSAQESPRTGGPQFAGALPAATPRTWLGRAEKQQTCQKDRRLRSGWEGTRGGGGGEGRGLALRRQRPCRDYGERPGRWSCTLGCALRPPEGTSTQPLRKGRREGGRTGRSSSDPGPRLPVGRQRLSRGWRGAHLESCLPVPLGPTRHGSPQPTSWELRAWWTGETRPVVAVPQRPRQPVEK